MQRAIGPYRVQAEVGRGGAGVVYRATGPGGAPVALKLLVAGRLATAAQRERFRREAEALQRVRHPQVVALLDQGEEQGVPWLALEWVEGESLEARLQREGPLEPRAAAELVRVLALALEHCHARGVLHRDLKPPNVLLRAGHDPLLVDFGLTLVLESETGGRLTRTGQLLGTPGWWAPEQAHGERLATGPTTDVYGLGALLFGALTGRPPQAGASLIEVLQALALDPIPPSQLRPGLPAGLDAICVRCLARSPHERYPDAGAVALELGRWLLQGRAPAPSRTPLLALTLLVLAGGLGLSLALLDPRARRDAPPAAESAGDESRAPADPLLSARAQVERGERAAARVSLQRAVADPAHAAEALWALHDLRTREDPAQAVELDEPIRALLALPAPGPNGTHSPWIDLARVVEQLARADPRAPEAARELTRAWPDLAWAHLLLGMAAPGLGTDGRPALLRAQELGLSRGVTSFLLAFECGNRELHAEARRISTDGLSDPSLGPTGRARLLLQRAVSLQAEDQTRAALEAIEAALREDPDLLDALTLQVMLRLRRRDLGQEDLRIARASMERIERQSPELSPLPLTARASLLEAEGDALGALRDVDRLLALRTGQPELRLQRAALLRELGRWEEALAETERHLREQPDDLRALLVRGELRERTGDPAGALADLNAFLRAVPRDSGAARAPFDLRARLLLRAGELHEARREAHAAASVPGEEWQARLTLARLVVLIDDDLATAHTELDQITAARPQFYEAWVAKSEACVRGDRWAESVQALRTAERLAPLTLESRVNLAVGLMEQGRSAEARPLLEQVLRERPNGPLALNGHARACLELHDYPAALASAERLLRLAQLSDERLRLHVRWTRALALAGLGRRSEAEAERVALLAERGLDAEDRVELERGLPAED